MRTSWIHGFPDFSISGLCDFVGVSFHGCFVLRALCVVGFLSFGMFGGGRFTGLGFLVIAGFPALSVSWF